MASLFGITADHTDDLGQLREYLRRHGVGEKDVEGAMLAVWLALGRYRENVVAPSDESVRMHVEKIAATAAALLKTIDGADAVDALAWRGLVAPPINFGIDVRFVRDAATDALKRLKVNGRMGYLTPEAAREQYRVIADDKGEVDLAATMSLRAEHQP